ncbi:ATP-binding protein [uncultured Helicobacter sp.]|uniref:ATP-binding protein n=1 Tax=uncultured Helicobacter sp. TaxID=175537 RepID=UPI002598874D|nr:ATP-binding protein [uncultured Helicobacter sp.]
MQYLNDFLKHKDIKKTAIYPHLKCSADEARILLFMTKMLFEGSNEIEILQLLKACFGNEQNTIIAHLPKIKNLLDSGWIISSGFIRTKDWTLLELLSTEVCLSPSFYRLLEEGSPKIDIPEITPYSDHLEFLKDQFLRIDMLKKINLDSKGLSVSRMTHQLKIIEERIKARLAITTANISVLHLIKENNLNFKEEIIFFALLKEEYAGGDGIYREMNTLIELISIDEYDKIKNRSLLDEKSPLIQKNLIDYDEMLNPFGGIIRTFYIPEEILQKITHQNAKKTTPRTTLASVIKNQEVFELLEPKTSLKDIILPPHTQSMLESILQQVDSRVIARLKEWGIKDKNKGIEAKILFFGPPGTGKTLSALGLAKALKKQILSFDCSKILSMYVGESEKNVRKIFDDYKEISKKIKNEPVLLLDEADQFLSLRASSGNATEKMHNQMQNIFLEQIEKFSGILIATTNLIETIDSAFSRRFNYKIEFRRPTQEQRESIWKKYLPQNATYAKNDTIHSLSKELCEYDLSGAQIALIIKNTAYKVATRERPVFSKNDFIEEIKREISGNFDGGKSVGFNAI